MKKRASLILLIAALVGCRSGAQESGLVFPKLDIEPVIDGDLSEWKDEAFDSGVWDLERIAVSPYVTKRNRLVVDEGEDTNDVDLKSNYYLAWKGDWLYFGAEVVDNVNDVVESKHEPKRWYYKDAIALFLEVPKDSLAEKFEKGDHGFAFVIDTSYPDYGAWWRHGGENQSYIEEPLPNSMTSYKVRMAPTPDGVASYVLEARINVREAVGAPIQPWGRYQGGERYGFMIVHCDPDGGEYGGHLLIYGKGDLDSSWEEMTFSE